MAITATQISRQARADIGSMIEVVGSGSKVFARLSEQSGVGYSAIYAFHRGDNKHLGVENLDAVVTALQKCRGWTDE